MTMIHPYLTDGTKSDQSIWEIATTVVGESEAVHPVGTRGVLPDGRVYYYARQSAAAAIVAGKLLGAELQTDQFDQLEVDATAIGDTTIGITALGTTPVTLNEYAEGYAVVLDELGEGVTYKIASHPLAATSAALVLTLHDPVQVLFHADTTIQLLKNLWCDVIPATAGQEHVPVGVSNVAVPAGNTVPQYFWCQTWGIVSVWHDETVTIGEVVATGDTASQVQIRAADSELPIGVAVWTGADTEYAPIYLTIAP